MLERYASESNLTLHVKKQSLKALMSVLWFYIFDTVNKIK